MRHCRAFLLLSFALMAVGGACTSFGSDTDPPGGDAAVSDGATGTATATATTTTTTPSGSDASGPGADAGGDALSPGWGAAFVSAATTKGNLGPMQVQADTICTNEGQKLRPNGKFVALLVRSDGESLFARAQSSGPRYLPNGDGSQGDLAITNVATPGGTFKVVVHADGGAVTIGRRVWTGQPDDAGAIRNCSRSEGAWATALSGFQGATASASPGAASYALSTCDQTESLFCVEVGNFQ